MGTDTKKQKGERLKRYVLDRMAERGIGTLVQLAEDAPVSYDTLHAWFRGRAPGAGSGGRVANSLGITYTELLAAYDGVSVSGRFVTTEELEGIVTAAAEAAVRKALRRNGKGPT